MSTKVIHDIKGKNVPPTVPVFVPAPASLPNIAQQLIGSPPFKLDDFGNQNLLRPIALGS